MKYKCVNCNEPLYLNGEYEETSCRTCGYVHWLKVDYRAVARVKDRCMCVSMDSGGDCAFCQEYYSSRAFNRAWYQALELPKG